MSPLFDGRARVYSTCRRCGQIMTVLNAQDTVHPTCEPRMNRLESLCQGYRSACEAGDDQAAELTAQEIEREEHKDPELRRAAVWYAQWGWPVFGLRQVGTHCDGGEKCADLCQCPKKPATPNGFKNATTDVQALEKFWRPYTRYNVGLATGHLFDVIDIDPRTGGTESFTRLLEQQRLPDIHAVAVTASGGLHLYIKPTGKGCGAGFMPGIDFRGVGGYVVAPPSTLGPRERSWSWLTVPSPNIKRHNG